MAIYVPNQPCSICAQKIKAGEEKTLLPPFCSNDADPLFALSDAVIHTSCLKRHPHAKQLDERLVDFNRARNQFPKHCSICDRRITDPDEYMSFGSLGDDVRALRWNYMSMHRQCLSRWGELSEVIDWIEWAEAHGHWSDGGLRWLSTNLRNALSAEPS